MKPDSTLPTEDTLPANAAQSPEDTQPEDNAQPIEDPGTEVEAQPAEGPGTEVDAQPAEDPQSEAGMSSESSPQAVPKRPVRLVSLLSTLLFPLTLVYWEILLAFGVNGGPEPAGLVHILLFSLSAGAAVQLLVSLFPAKVNRILRQLFLILLAVPYGVEYFVFRQFKVLYDVSTIINGAGGVVTGFMRDAWLLISSPTGILFLVLLLLPAVLYAILVFRLDQADRLRLRSGLCWLGAVLVLFALGWGSVRLSSFTWGLYSAEAYNFEDAVRYFGLLTGLRLDVQYLNTKDEPAEFEVVVTQPPQIEESVPAETAPEETEPVVYGRNELDLPLEACKAGYKNLCEYVGSLTASSKNAYTGLFAGKNLIFITAEAFTAEVIDPELTPTLYRLANSGFQFTDYYQHASAGTTGGEVLNLFGLLPTEGGSSMAMITSHYVMDMATFLTPLGYTGGAFHNNDCTFYNRHITHNKLGYPDGFMGIGSGMEEYVVNKFPQSDLEMLQGTLPRYLEQDRPFNLYYMSVSGHSIYTWINSSAIKHQEEVSHLDYPEKIRVYLACQLELEAALRYTVEALEEAGKADDTVICISTDHFPYGLDDSAGLGSMTNLSTLYGYPVNTRLGRDHNRLILWSGCLEDQEPVEISSPTSSMDILPTLCNLFGVDFDSRLMPGRDVFSDAEALVFNLSYDWKTDLGIYTRADGFTPASPDTQVPEGYVDRINAIVKNKINYCKSVVNTNFFGSILKDLIPSA